MSLSSSLPNGPLRQSDVDRHNGTRDEFLFRHTLAAHEAVMQGSAAVQKFADDLLHRVMDERNLRIAWNWQTRRWDVAPGPNDWLVTDFSESDVWNLLKALQGLLRNETYIRGPVRTINVPKGLGRTGTRPLKLLNLEERVVQRAIVQIIQPVLDPQFADHVFGGRPGRGPLHALAAADALARREGRLVWITEDIKDCFEHVPLSRLLQIIRFYLPEDRLLRLIERCIEREGGKGLDQGAPLAPLLTNTYGHHLLDRLWRKRFLAIPLLRFIDDLLVMCTSTEEALAGHAALKQLLQDAGLQLKGTPNECIRNLELGQSAQWLGYQICYGQRGLELRLPPGRVSEEPYGQWLDRLRESLALAHAKPDAPLRAVQIVKGRIQHAGPCLKFTDSRELYAAMKKVLGEFGFAETLGYEAFQSCWEAAYRSWRRIRREALLQPPQQEESTEQRRPIRPATARFSQPTERCVLHTDGCYLPNSGTGGIAFHLQRGTLIEKVQIGLRRTTNSRAEVIAVIAGLERTPIGSAVRVVCDSEYVVRGGSERMLAWKARGWRRANGRRLKHVGLWQKLATLVTQRTVTWQWVRGHAGHPVNEDCDRRAKGAAMKMENELRTPGSQRLE